MITTTKTKHFHKQHNSAHRDNYSHYPYNQQPIIIPNSHNYFHDKHPLSPINNDSQSSILSSNNDDFDHNAVRSPNSQSQKKSKKNIIDNVNSNDNNINNADCNQIKNKKHRKPISQSKKKKIPNFLKTPLQYEFVNLHYLQQLLLSQLVK